MSLDSLNPELARRLSIPLATRELRYCDEDDAFLAITTGVWDRNRFGAWLDSQRAQESGDF